MKKKFLIVAAASHWQSAIGTTCPTVRNKTHHYFDEVVITANKYPNKTSLTGKVVTIITREQLERSGGKDLSQIVDRTSRAFILVALIAMQVKIKVCTCVAQEVDAYVDNDRWCSCI